MTDTFDVTFPECDVEDVLELMGAFSIYSMRLMEADARDRLRRLSDLQSRWIEENSEAIREAVLSADDEDFMWLPKVHDEFLDALDLVVINGEVRDKRTTIVYEGEEDDG